MIHRVAIGSNERGFTIVELIVVLLILGVLAAMAAVRLDRARMAGNEASAVGSLRAINASQATFASSCGGSGFAQSLDDLAKPPSGSTHGFVSPDLAVDGIAKSGYVIAVDPDVGVTLVTSRTRVCNAPAVDAMSSYFASAVPVSSRSGRRSFATDRQTSIFVRDDGLAIPPGMAGAALLE